MYKSLDQFTIQSPSQIRISAESIHEQIGPVLNENQELGMILSN